MHGRNMLIEYTSFLETPTAENYLAVRGRLLEESDWPPEQLPFVRLARLVVSRPAGRATRTLAESLSPLWLLSARVHSFQALIAEKCGNRDDFELSRFEAVACLEGLLATGNGTRRRPYRATYPSDVQDILSALHLRLVSQELISQRDHTYDVVRASDLRTYWFEQPMISVPVSLRGRMEWGPSPLAAGLRP